MTTFNFYSRLLQFLVQVVKYLLCAQKASLRKFVTDVLQVIVMAGSNNLSDKKNERLMGPVETSDEMAYLILKLKFYRFLVSIFKLLVDVGSGHICLSELLLQRVCSRTGCSLYIIEEI